MTLVRFNPARRAAHFGTDFDRLINNFFGTTAEDQEIYGGLRPVVNMEETNDDYQISIELPGMKKDEVKLTFHDGTLSISGEKKAGEEVKDGKYHRFERRYGKFCRNIDIPSNIVSDKISAEYLDGVLNVTLPKTEEVKPKEIQVKVK